MNNDIINLIKKLRDKKCNDLADLLKGCRSSTEETTQYGSYHNQFISGFIIYAPPDKYRELQKTRSFNISLSFTQKARSLK